VIEIDGSQGEGGGQVLRTSLALSLITGTPFRIFDIRANRKPPGLRKQHLAAVRAAAQVGAAQVQGAEVGARELTFTPGEVKAGDHRFAVGSAGSCTLVLQTVLPPLLLAKGTSRLTLEGGTHNPKAPTFDFLDRVYLPLVERLGPRVKATLDRPGFYPAGGGAMRCTIEPAPLAPHFKLLERGRIVDVRAVALVANLPRHIGERELEIVRRRMQWREQDCRVVEDDRSPGPGNALMLEVEAQHGRELVSAFGERGVRAEDVAKAAVRELEAFLAADVPVGEHLADQLLLLLALAGGGSFRTLPLSGHATTQIDVMARFLPVKVAVTQVGDQAHDVRVTRG
jgi:RNA 3'-terminal phosphate cyclase (ATP)